jgi:hypothetical protein
MSIIIFGGLVLGPSIALGTCPDVLAPNRACNTARKCKKFPKDSKRYMDSESQSLNALNPWGSVWGHIGELQARYGAGAWQQRGLTEAMGD